MLAIIDSFEGDYCIIEVDGVTQNINKSLVEKSAKVGDVVEWNGQKWITNRNQTIERSRSIKKLMDDLWED
ncbi:hypothetical protein D3C77_309470 [compost metagenome]